MLAILLTASWIAVVSCSRVQVQCDSREYWPATIESPAVENVTFVTITNCVLNRTSLPNVAFAANAGVLLQEVAFEADSLAAGFFHNLTITSIVINATELVTIEPGAFFATRMREISLLRNYNLRLTASMFSPVQVVDSLTITNTAYESLPDELFGSIVVRNLTLSALQLTSVPNNVLRSLGPSLVSLDLSENALLQLSFEFESPTLKHLYLVNDQIEIITPGSFSKFPNLETLSLMNNQLSDLDPTWFAENRRLKVINLQTNRLITLNNDLFNWPIVEKLTLADNMWECGCDLFRLATQLRSGVLESADLTCFGPQEYKDLLVLDLGGPLCGDTTTTTSTSTSTSTTATTVTTPRSTGVCNTSPGTKVSSTTTVDSSSESTSNSENTTETSSVASFTEIAEQRTTVGTIETTITQIPDSFTNTLTIDCEKDLDRNSSLTNQSNEQLRREATAADLQNCLLMCSFLQDMLNLSSLSLISSQFKQETLRQDPLPRLTQLSIVESNMVSLADADCYLSASLQELRLVDNSKLDLVSKPLRGLNRLRTLILVNSNARSKLPLDLFDGLSLQTLALENLALRSVPSQLLKSVSTSLLKLSLRDNSIRSLRTSLNAPLLTELDLSNNQLRELSSNAFFGYPNLQVLSLASNRIANLDDRLFGHNSQLSKVDLSGNLLITLNSQLFNWLSLQELQIQYNPFTCTCQLYSNLKRLPGNATQHITCNWPAGYQLADLGEKLCS